MNHIIEDFSNQERCALLSMLASFNTQDGLNICKAYYTIDAAIGPTNELSFSRKKISLILVTCRYFLSTLNLGRASDRFHRQELSTNQYTATLDGIYSRSIISEILLDLESSRYDLQQIINHVKPFEVGQLPGVCGYLTLCATCRLPLIESKSTDCVNEAMISFQSCIGSEGLYRNYLPVSLVLALTVAAATMRITIAFQSYMRSTGISKDTMNIFSFLEKEYNNDKEMSTILSDNIRDELLIAYRLLQQMYFYLQSSSEVMSETLSSERTFLQPFKSLIGCITNYLPDDTTSYHQSFSDGYTTEYFEHVLADEGHYKIVTDPILLSSQVPRSSAGILLAGITKFLFFHFGLELEAIDIRTSNGHNSISQMGRQGRLKNSIQRKQHPSPDRVDPVSDDNHESGIESQHYDVNSEVYGLIYWAFQLEIKPGAIVLWNLAYANLGINRVQEAFRLFSQCHEEITLQKQRFEVMKPSTAGMVTPEAIFGTDTEGGVGSPVNKREIEESTNRQESIEPPSVQHLIRNNTAFDLYYQQMLQWLGMYAQPLKSPWLPSVTLAELTIRLGFGESQIVRCMQILFDTLIQMFDGVFGSNLLETVLSIDLSTSQMLSSWHQFLPHSKIKPIIFETGLGETFVFNVQRFHESVNKNRLVHWIRALLSSNDKVVANIGMGLLMILIQYGKCHAELSRLDRVVFDVHSAAASHNSMSARQLCDQERYFHQSVALRCFSLLYMINFDSAIKLNFEVPVQLEGEILLHYLVLSFDCNRDDEDQRKESLAFLKHILRSPSDVVETGVFLHDKLNLIRLRHPQWYSHLHPKFVHLLTLCITEESSHSPDIFAVAISLLQNHVYHEYSVIRRDEMKAGISHFHGQDDVHNSANMHLWNVRYTVMLLLFYSGDYTQTLIFAEDLIRNIRDFMSYQRYEGSVSNHYQRIFPFYYHLINQHREIIVTNSMACRVLLHISQICCKLHKLSLAKFACTEYFRILYSIDGDVIDQLVNLPNRKDTLSDHEIIDTFKNVPTMLGWKLYTGYGVSYQHDFSLEADGICQCAHILQIESASMEDSKHKIVDLLNLAISMCPTNVRTLAAFAQIFEDRFRKQLENHNDQQPLQQLNGLLQVALQYVKKALFYNTKNPGLW
jgi:hypothetical protein